jgi:hypothetical protein
VEFGEASVQKLWFSYALFCTIFFHFRNSSE